MQQRRETEALSVYEDDKLRGTIGVVASRHDALLRHIQRLSQARDRHVSLDGSGRDKVCACNFAGIRALEGRPVAVRVVGAHLVSPWWLRRGSAAAIHKDLIEPALAVRVQLADHLQTKVDDALAAGDLDRLKGRASSRACRLRAPFFVGDNSLSHRGGISDSSAVANAYDAELEKFGGAGVTARVSIFSDQKAGLEAASWSFAGAGSADSFTGVWVNDGFGKSGHAIVAIPIVSASGHKCVVEVHCARRSLSDPLLVGYHDSEFAALNDVSDADLLKHVFWLNDDGRDPTAEPATTPYAKAFMKLKGTIDSLYGNWSSFFDKTEEWLRGVFDCDPSQVNVDELIEFLDAADAPAVPAIPEKGGAESAEAKAFFAGLLGGLAAMAVAADADGSPPTKRVCVAAGDGPRRRGPRDGAARPRANTGGASTGGGAPRDDARGSPDDDGGGPSPGDDDDDGGGDPDPGGDGRNPCCKRPRARGRRPRPARPAGSVLNANLAHGMTANQMINFFPHPTDEEAAANEAAAPEVPPQRKSSRRKSSRGPGGGDDS